MVDRIKSGRVMVAITTLALVVAACGGSAATTAPNATAEPTSAATSAPTTTPASGPVAVCELAYYTGEFAAYGESLSNDVVFP